MLVILSPSKDMRVASLLQPDVLKPSYPEYLSKASELIAVLRNVHPDRLPGLMNISKKLAEQTLLRIYAWNSNHSLDNACSSILAFTGEAFRGLDAQTLPTADLIYSQSVLRILSGLYGVLKPLDLMQEYRLEMATKIDALDNRSLYSYWGNGVTASLKRAIEKSPGQKVLVNLASAEYSSVIRFNDLTFPVIAPVFKEEKNGKLKTVVVYTKRARGLMTRFIIENRIKKCEEIKAFTDDGYYFSNQLSDDGNWVFIR